MAEGPKEFTSGLAQPVELRPATADDEPFLFEVYASTRAQELALTNWSDDQKQAFLRMQFTAQQQHYRTHDPEAEHSIIMLDGMPIGRIYVARREDEIRILDITILPAHRNRRIGSPIIEGLAAEASEARKPVTIYVESYGQSLRLFERLGFHSVEDNGVHRLMRREPADG
jgi:N-acetylglutamate synthase-like GNAT family acetyltransferase